MPFLKINFTKLYMQIMQIIFLRVLVLIGGQIMQIQNNNSTSFGYGYKFIRMPKEAREELPNIIQKGKTIYNQFEGKKNNSFLITKEHFHDIVAAFIRKHNLNYRFYPQVKPEMDFKLGHPEKVSEIIKDMQPAKINYTKELEQRMAERAVKQAICEKSPGYTKNISKTLGMELDLSTLKSKNGAKILDDKNKRNRIIISPPDKNDLHYVRVQQMVSMTDSEDRRYAMTSDGLIVRTYSDIDDIMVFNKLFNQTLIK